MQKPVLVSVPVPVFSTVPPKVSWGFELYLYLELPVTVPQVSDCCLLGQLVFSFNFTISFYLAQSVYKRHNSNLEWNVLLITVFCSQ